MRLLHAAPSDLLRIGSGRTDFLGNNYLMVGLLPLCDTDGARRPGSEEPHISLGSDPGALFGGLPMAWIGGASGEPKSNRHTMPVFFFPSSIMHMPDPPILIPVSENPSGAFDSWHENRPCTNTTEELWFSRTTVRATMVRVRYPAGRQVWNSKRLQSKSLKPST